MELAFVWIRQYRNIKKFQSNFLFNYSFNAEENENKKLIIKLKKDNYLPNNFFSRQNHINIKAFIGKNGSGKSNIIEFLLLTLAKGNRPSNLDYFFIFKSDQNWVILNRSKMDLICDDFNFEFITSLKFIDENYNFAFFSNVEQKEEYSFNKEINLKNNNTVNKIRYISHLYNRNKSILTNLDNNFSGVYFKLKNNVNIDQIKDDRILLILNRYDRALKTTPSWSNLLSYFITKTYLMSIVIDLSINEQILIKLLNEFDYSNSIVTQKINITHNKIITFFNELVNKKYNIAEKVDLVLVLKVIDKLGKINDNTSNKVQKDYSAANNYIKVHLNKKLLSVIDNPEENIIFEKADIISHDWSNLSSGIKAFLDLFSNLYVLISQSNKQYLFVSIDECDLYFHPELQRQILSILLKFFDDEFKDKKINLILSSHSPFLVADLPDRSIKVIDTENNNNQFPQKTFASNIYSLFDNQFFLTNGSLGEFSKSKINNIISDINNNIKSEEILQTIKIIGEETIKNILLDKLNSSNHKDTLIKYYKEQIELIEKNV